MSEPLLPTPNGQNFNDGQSTENWRARKARERAKGYNGNGGGTPIAMAAKLIAEGIDPNSGDLPTSASSQGSEGSTSPRKRKQPFEEWFWQQVEPKWTDAWKTGLSEPCWEWQHTKATDGYGAVSYEGRQRKAHRVAWVLATGEIIPKGMYLCHRCDNPPCVNPEHLYVGTNQQNQRDAVERGQHKPQRGEAHGMARLTLEQVQEMRRLFADGLNQRELADRFGTTLANVHLIVRGKKWKSDPLLPTPRAQDEYERSNRKTIDRANMGEAQQTLTRWVKGNSPTSPSSAEWEVSILRLRALASGQSDRSSTSQPALPFSNDTGPESHAGEMSMGSPLLPTPSAQKHSPQRRKDFTPNLTFRVQERVATPGLGPTSSSADTPASRRATLESGRAKRMTAGSGPSSPESLASLDRAWFYSRTYRAFSQWKETSMPPLTDAYAAGLIDGEGCIGISESNKRTQPTYGVRVEVGMSEKALPLLRQMEATFGGTIRQTRKASAKWEAAWTWGLFSAQQASNFLMRIEPHLVLKGEQARSALRLLAMLDDLPKDKRGRPRWTVQTRKDAASLRALVMDMNRKGPTTTEQVGWLARYVGGQWLTDQRSLLDPTGWEKFSGIWPRSGMTRRGRLYALPMSALPTVESDGSASLNVPTPTASDAVWGDKDHSRRGIVGNHNLGLTDWVKVLPTPRVEGFDAGNHRGQPDSLNQTIRYLPTPKTPTGGPENRTSKKRRGSGGANLEGSLGDLTQPPSPDGSE